MSRVVELDGIVRGNVFMSPRIPNLAETSEIPMREIIHSKRHQNPLAHTAKPFGLATLYSFAADSHGSSNRRTKNGHLGRGSAMGVENLCAVLDAAGATPKDVVKCSIFLTDMALFSQVNTYYAQIFSESAQREKTVAVLACQRVFGSRFLRRPTYLCEHPTK